jgi:hypothetical protein
MTLILLICLGFVTLGLLLAGVIGEVPDPDTSSRRGRGIPPELLPYFGWFCAALFGMGVPVIIRRFFDHDVQVAIGESGIRVLRWSEATIPWSEIQRVSVWSYQRQKHIILHLVRPEAFPGRGIAARLARANRMLTGGDIAITLVGTDGSFDDAMAAIKHFGGRGLFA